MTTDLPPTQIPPISRIVLTYEQARLVLEHVPESTEVVEVAVSIDEPHDELWIGYYASSKSDILEYMLKLIVISSDGTVSVRWERT